MPIVIAGCRAAPATVQAQSFGPSAEKAAKAESHGRELEAQHVTNPDAAVQEPSADASKPAAAATAAVPAAVQEEA